VIDQKKGAILRGQKSVEADFRERLHDLFLWSSHCICVATSRRLFFEGPSWLRFNRISDGPSKTFPLLAGHFVMQGASMVLLGMSPIVEIPDS
jgi:hypothetical protein